MRELSDRDKDNLAAILDYCDRIISIVERFGSSFEQFNQDEDYRDAVLLNVFQIGEATHRLSNDCKEIINTVPWHEIYGTRNVIAHGYVKVKNEIIWEIVEKGVPLLKQEIGAKARLL